MVNNLPCNAGDMGSIPGWGTKTLHAMEKVHLSTLEPEHSYRAGTPQLESPHAATEAPMRCNETRRTQIDK